MEGATLDCRDARQRAAGGTRSGGNLFALCLVGGANCIASLSSFGLRAVGIGYRRLPRIPVHGPKDDRGPVRTPCVLSTGTAELRSGDEHAGRRSSLTGVGERISPGTLSPVAYELGIRQGADVFEIDVVMTRDGHLPGTRTISPSRPMSAATRSLPTDAPGRTVDGHQQHGWFTEDFASPNSPCCGRSSPARHPIDGARRIHRCPPPRDPDSAGLAGERPRLRRGAEARGQVAGVLSPRPDCRWRSRSSRPRRRPRTRHRVTRRDSCPSTTAFLVRLRGPRRHQPACLLVEENLPARVPGHPEWTYAEAIAPPAWRRRRDTSMRSGPAGPSFLGTPDGRPRGPGRRLHRRPRRRPAPGPLDLPPRTCSCPPTCASVRTRPGWRSAGQVAAYVDAGPHRDHRSPGPGSARR